MSEIFDYEKLKGDLYNTNFNVKGGAKKSKTAKIPKNVKIPKKEIDKLYEKINVMYKLYNKKNKTMRGGANIIPDNYLNISDLDLKNYIQAPYEASSLFPVSLSKFV